MKVVGRFIIGINIGEERKRLLAGNILDSMMLLTITVEVIGKGEVDGLDDWKKAQPEREVHCQKGAFPLNNPFDSEIFFSTLVQMHTL